ncbi:GDSL-type esterase/lipase family protein [Nocardiopsis halophila]|uniref:GDSL-type esterase/lipase family protein n=1 Tax=Nocardiopsis halophila TaxID=141692 RepID=UPI00037C180A|nr:GDSL-type esterase/lipase family protein [Nocardiopsis halophila]
MADEDGGPGEGAEDEDRAGGGDGGGTGGTARPRRLGLPRFEPTPLGLVGVALGAMFATLLVIQAALGSFRTGAPDEEPSPPPASGTPPEGTARILVAGDSVVQGSSGDFTWRYRLWRHLEDEGVDADFVGPYDDVLDVNSGRPGSDAYADPGFDTDHAGVWGATTEDTAASLGEHVAEYEPHYLLFMAGINDFAEDSSPAWALEAVRDAVTAARVADGGVQIVLGEVTPVAGTGRDEELNGKVRAFNEGLAELAAQLSGPGPVVVAPAAEGYAAEDDNWDTTHPNARGELKIAAAFADALAGDLGLGGAYERPLPDVAVGPRQAPEVGVEDEGGGDVRLSWDPVPGATRYQVLQRRVRPDPDEEVALPAQVEGEAGGTRSVTVDRLLSGAVYEFTVRPYKGGDAGRGSEPERIEVDPEPPGAPERLRVEEDGGGDPELAWEGADGAGHYEVVRREMACRDPSPEPDPSPTGDPDAGQSPEPSPPAECAPVDGEGPEEGRGWTTAAIVDEGTAWPLPPTRGTGYEYAVRSHRDYVEGAYSGTVEYTG